MKRVEFHKNLLNILWLYQQQGIIDITGKKATVPSAIRFLTATFSNSVIMMLAKTGPEDEPINTPSFSLFVAEFHLFNEKNKDIYQLFKQNIVDGPSIIFN